MSKSSPALLTIDDLVESYGNHDERSWPRQDRGALTVGRIFSYLTGADARRFLKWPPDVFAVCAAVLKLSGAYTASLDPAPGHELVLWSRDEIARLAACWRRWAGVLKTRPKARRPAELRELCDKWHKILRAKPIPLPRVVCCPELISALVDCLAVADEACEGSGLPLGRPKGGQPENGDAHGLIEDGWLQLRPGLYGSTLCRDIHPSAGRVLPRMHTPQSGLTLRSFSHHLAYCETDEVQPRWFMIPGAAGRGQSRDRINLLVVPWPDVCTPALVREVPSNGEAGTRRLVRAGTHPDRYFTYTVQDCRPAIADRVEALCDEAEKIVGSVDGVVMPELALNAYDYAAVRERVLKRCILLIAGIGEEACGRRRGDNRLCIDIPLSCYHAVHMRQDKHHRWKLNGPQIRNYHLGARLDPSHSYWEDIAISERRLLFIVLRPWLVTTVLICEDLARHDPVGELLRGVGPNLVTALLMDGPQLASRWSSRYAAALADDPGCSVLSVSSMGMVRLSRPDPTGAASRVVALWKDARSAATELSLPEDAAALVLTLSLQHDPERSADGRDDEGIAALPVLTGVHPVKVPKLWNRVRRDWEVSFLSPHEAASLARLAQYELDQKRAAVELSELQGEALAIAHELCRMRRDSTDTEWMQRREDYASPPTPEQTETAARIREWGITNYRESPGCRPAT